MCCNTNSKRKWKLWKMSDLLEQANNVVTLGECLVAMMRRCIKQLEERSRAKRPRLLIENKQSLVARIVRGCKDSTAEAFYMF